MADAFSLFPHLWWVPLLALALDLLLADSLPFPHPVQGIGRLLDWLEPFARRQAHSSPGSIAPEAVSVRLRWGGFFSVLLVTGVCVLVVAAGAALPSILGLAVLVYFSYAGLALGGLVREGRKCLALLRTNDVEASRRAVSMLVSRDLSTANMQTIRMSLAESVSENFNDAFVAPFFWLLLAGPAGLWIYKAASTMDSCWGYKTPRHRDFGRACARLDDFLAYVPARLSALLLWGAAQFGQAGACWPGWPTVGKEAGAMESPNAGWPMATAAWLLGGEMGGALWYHGQLVHKPRRGPAGAEWGDEKLEALFVLVLRAGLAGGGIMWLAALFAYS